MPKNQPADRLTKGTYGNYQSGKQEKLSKKLSSLSEAALENQVEQTAERNGMRYANLRGFPIDQEAMILVPEEEARDNNYAIINRQGKNLVVVTTIPNNEKIRDLWRRMEDENGYTIATKYLVSQSSFDYLLNLYKTAPKIIVATNDVDITAESLLKAQEEVKNIEALKGKIREVETSELLELIIAGSVASKSSDIHIDPEKEQVQLRYRIDGILQNVTTIPHNTYKRVLSRVKLLSGMKLNISNVPQDGRFTIDLGEGRAIDLRISLLPTAYGETLVIRLLGTGETSLSVKDLGMRGDALKIIEEEIAKPNGMILTTGPTGSGKTTSLYAFINKIKKPEINIITLENPIEYRLDGVSQTQIDTDAGMTFASGLRSILRQDPDVIMVGEIRDLETAEIACQAALTGHIVFSTLHTNDASGVIPRFINMGIRPFVLGPALNAMIAQRLVRRLCEKCKISYKPDMILLDKMKEEMAQHYPKKVSKFYKANPEGCKECSLTGYKGRVGIYEVIRNDKFIRSLIDARASADEIIDAAARKQNTVFMRQDGLLRVIEGITSLEEIDRVT
ncbi:MAG: GspE/PulE family protein [bacterium]